MKNLIPSLVIGLIVLSMTGCASVQFYSNKNLTEKTGLKYYAVKPFLHVEKEAVTNRIIKATVIYLPDLANPQYMVLRDGFGSRKVNLKLTDGSINTFGYTYISKIGESTDALAAMITKSTDAVTSLNTAIPGMKAPSNTVELYEIVFTPEKTILKKVELGD